MNQSPTYFHVDKAGYHPNDVIHKTIHPFNMMSYRRITLSLKNLHNCTDNILANQIVRTALSDFKKYVKIHHIKFNLSISETFSYIIREIIAENVRINYFPQCPSREISLFIFDNLSDAIKFLTEFRNNNFSIYECSPLMPTTLFRGNMDLITHNLADKLNPITFRNNMFTYWQGNISNSTNVEILCPRPLCIKKVINLS